MGSKRPMTSIDLAEKLLDHIRLYGLYGLYGRSKAKQVAAALGVGRTVVNDVLLRGRVRQLRDQTWSLAQAPQIHQDVGGLPKNSRGSLFEILGHAPSVCQKFCTDTCRDPAHLTALRSTLRTFSARPILATRLL
jgi:hypothetical protein